MARNREIIRMLFLLLRLFCWIVGIGFLAGYYFFLKAMIMNSDQSFGDGLGLGSLTMIILFYATWRLSPKSFDRDKSGRD
jgi:hypothetical protein